MSVPDPTHAVPAAAPGKAPPYWLWLTLGGTTFGLLIFAGNAFLPERGAPSWTWTWIGLNHAIFVTICFIIYGFVRLTERLPRWWSWTALGGFTALTALAAATINYSSIIWFARNDPGFRINYGFGIGFNFMIYVWMFGFFATAQKVLRMLELERVREARLGEARLAAGRAQLRALQHQVSPHFLFNTLNAISSLIATGRKRESLGMMGRLSEYFRASTAVEQREMTSLREELQMIEAYLAIEQVRFGRRIAFHIDREPGMNDARVPNFLLQPLVENAVKHAVAPSSRKVAIRVKARILDGRLCLTVEDDGRVRKTAAGFGIGLRNVRERLALLYREEAAIETRLSDKGFSVSLSLPLDFPLERQAGAVSAPREAAA